MRISILGSLDAPVAGARLRALLIMLALQPGRAVSTARLIDGIWGEDPPARAANALQVLVSRLRKALPDAPVESHPAGYLLAVEPDAVDVTRFERLVAEARSADDATKARLLKQALDLWRGPALQDVADEEFFRPHVARLTEMRLSALEDRVEAELRLGHDPTAELTSLVAEHPLRERLVGALMRALCATGQTNEALKVYERAREALADALGADPSPELNALHTSILRGTADIRPQTNLRAGLTSFVGRDEDVAHVVKLIGEHRLTTLTGLGGAGKTRLSIEAARKLLDQTPDGVWLVELAPVTDGADIAQAVLGTLGLRDQALISKDTGEPIDRLSAALSTRNTLLVLDNCEHVIDAAAALAERLLGECADLRILATSREPLSITGEALWPVEPLTLPPEGASVAEAMASSAVRLLVDRASAARPGFAVTEQTVSDVVRICRALDGVPLAIELSAARLRTMTTAQLASRLGDRFRLLTGGSRMALPRHQTLRAVVDWSWDLLSDPERTVLRRLAVFSGGATLEAAERVCGEDAFDLLSALADKSLVVAGERYRLLETIKEYGLEKLDQAGERDQIRRAHAACFIDLAETADPYLRGPDQLIWLDRLTAEHDNINAALRGAIAAGEAQTAMRLVGAVGWYWWLGGHQVEGTDLAIMALELPGPVDEETRAVAYAAAALLSASGHSNGYRVEEFFEAAKRFPGRAKSRNQLLRLVEPVRLVLGGLDLPADEDPWVRATTRLFRASVLLSTGHPHADAEADLSAAVAGFQEVGDRWGYSFALANLANLIAWRGELATARAHYERAIAVGAELGANEEMVKNRLQLAQVRFLLGDMTGCQAAVADAEREAKQTGLPSAIATVHFGAADIARFTGEESTARTRLTKARELARHVSVNWGIRSAIAGSLGYLAALEGDLDAARAHHAEACSVVFGAPNTILIAHIVVGVADLALHQGQPREAARLLAVSDAIRGARDLIHPDVVRITKAARAALGDEEFAKAAQRGQNATVEDLPEMVKTTLG